MAAYTINFGNAFERWHAAAQRERAAINGMKSGTVRSREALDHVCGLAVEAGLKALLIHHRVVTPEKNGDFPPDSLGKRPHINELWDKFQKLADGRIDASHFGALASKTSGFPFAAWESSHRYASDGTVGEATVAQREKYLKALHGVVQEIGL